MSDLIIKANKIICLVDKHGEPSRCRANNCETCKEIKKLRNEIGRDKRKNAKVIKPKKGLAQREMSGGCKGKYIYIVSKDGKEVARVGSTYKVAEIIGINASHITYMVKNNRPSRGYEVERYLKEFEEETK